MVEAVTAANEKRNAVCENSAKKSNNPIKLKLPIRQIFRKTCKLTCMRGTVNFGGRNVMILQLRNVSIKRLLM